jgi:hypothetical protein
MSDSILHKLSIVAESDYGEVPVNPEWSNVRHGGCTMKLNRSAHASPELRNDRNLADHRLGVHDVNGDIAMEMLYESDGPISILLQSLAIGTGAGITPVSATDISASSVDNSINKAAGSLPEVIAGDTILIAGFTGTVGNNGYATVVSRTASKIVISGKTLVTDTAGESVTITPQTSVYSFDGSNRGSQVAFSLERDFGENASDARYQRLTGCNVSSMNVKSPADGNVSVTFTIMGQNMATSSSIVSGATYLDPSTVRPMDSYTGNLAINGTTSASITEFDLTISNNLANRFVVGSKLTQNHTIGQRSITGSFTAFFDSAEWIAKFTDETSFAVVHTIKDPAGNSISFHFPKVYITAAPPDTQGPNGEITLNLPFVAVYDTTSGYAVQVRLNPALS